MTRTNDKSYVTAAVPTWNYIGLDDALPPKGKKIMILTQGGVAIFGNWDDKAGYIAWAPLLKRDFVKENMLEALKTLRKATGGDNANN